MKEQLPRVDTATLLGTAVGLLVGVLLGLLLLILKVVTDGTDLPFWGWAVMFLIVGLLCAAIAGFSLRLAKTAFSNQKGVEKQ